MLFLGKTCVGGMQAEKELEKEMGDAGDDAEVLDEKMWLGEEDGEEAEDTEQRKDVGTTDAKSNSKVDEETRKLVAGDGEEPEQQEDQEGNDENSQVRPFDALLHSITVLDVSTRSSVL